MTYDDTMDSYYNRFAEFLDQFDPLSIDEQSDMDDGRGCQCYLNEMYCQFCDPDKYAGLIDSMTADSDLVVVDHDHDPDCDFCGLLDAAW